MQQHEGVLRSADGILDTLVDLTQKFQILRREKLCHEAVHIKELEQRAIRVRCEVGARGVGGLFFRVQ